jgi:hypothetical protein
LKFTSSNFQIREEIILLTDTSGTALLAILAGGTTFTFGTATRFFGGSFTGRSGGNNSLGLD